MMSYKTKEEELGLDSDEVEFYEKSFKDVGVPVISDPILRAKIGTMIFIISEIMLFGGLISSYFVMRKEAIEWPPEGQPRYPVWQTAFNSAFLFASLFFMILFDKFRRRNLLFFSTVLGGIFILLQGIEWVRLIEFGLTLTSSSYGSIFYVIVGTHMFHAFGGLLWLALAYFGSRDSKNLKTPIIEGASLFWKFVVLIWPLIYISVFLV